MPRRRPCSTASSVPRKRGSSGARKRRSSSWIRLASRSSPPKVADRRSVSARQAAASIRARIVSARSCQNVGALGRGPARRRRWPAGRTPPSTSPPNRCGRGSWCATPTGRHRAGRSISQARSPTGSSASKSSTPRHAEQPLVEERLDVGQDDLAIGVVLDLLIGLVADAHRPHAAIAGEAGLDPLDQRRLAADAVERLDMPALRHCRRCCADRRDSLRARRARRAG